MAFKSSETPHGTLDDGSFPNIESDLNQYLENFTPQPEIPMIKRIWQLLNTEISDLNEAIDSLLFPKMKPIKVGDVVLFWERA